MALDERTSRGLWGLKGSHHGGSGAGLAVMFTATDIWDIASHPFYLIQALYVCPGFPYQDEMTGQRRVIHWLFTEERRDWNWSKECQVAFDDLKQAMISDPEQTCSSGCNEALWGTKGCLRFLWGVLLQEGHPVAYESRKLSDPETRYTAQ